MQRPGEDMTVLMCLQAGGRQSVSDSLISCLCILLVQMLLFRLPCCDALCIAVLLSPHLIYSLLHLIQHLRMHQPTQAVALEAGHMMGVCTQRAACSVHQLECAYRPSHRTATCNSPFPPASFASFRLTPFSSPLYLHVYLQSYKIQPRNQIR